MSRMILTEESKITKALDKSEFSEISIEVGAGMNNSSFNIDTWKKGSPAQKMEEEKKKIKRWRQMALHPKVETVLFDIINEAVVPDSKNPVHVDTSMIELLDATKTVTNALKEGIGRAFSILLKKLHFKKRGTKIFRQWYIDGRLYVYVEYATNKKDGIKEMRILDPLKLTLLKEKNGSGKDEFYYVYRTNETEILKIPYKNVIFVPSGLVDENGFVISYLQKAEKPLNSLNMMENSLVIQRFVRAPERYVFRVDVSGMNKKKAKAYMENLQSTYRSRFNINPLTGELISENATLAMQENFWLAKTNSQNGGHEIDTIGGGANLSDIDDVIYWKKELSNALRGIEENDDNSTFSFGNDIDEITREEHKFFKFIKWIRVSFDYLFERGLYLQAIYSGVMTKDDWEMIIDDLDFEYENDSIYEEAKKRSRINGILDDASDHEKTAIRWYDEEWFRRNILKQTDKEAKDYKKAYEKSGEEEGGEEEGDDFDM